MWSESFVFKTQIFHANRSTRNWNHVCHFQHCSNPHEESKKAPWMVFVKMARKIMHTNLKYKCKIKSNNSKPRFEPKREHSYGLQIRTNQCTNEHVVVTPWNKDVPHRHEGRCQSKRALRNSWTHPSRIPGSAHSHKLTTVTDILTL